ncbi:universal stress protein [Archaeoglobus veneficus]|uniref:universal stress protein n=1 Tax=Archaeoglobus veneficus TaxID=58290 RepID=UPI000A02C322
MGTPYREILKTAKEEKASIIMLSSRFKRGLLSSTTDAVVRHSEIPVFVCKPRW